MRRGLCCGGGGVNWGGVTISRRGRGGAQFHGGGGGSVHNFTAVAEAHNFTAGLSRVVLSRMENCSMPPIFYAPNKITTSLVQVDGIRTYASNDVGTVLSGFLICDFTLGKLPTYKDRLQQVSDDQRVCYSGPYRYEVKGYIANMRMVIQYFANGSLVPFVLNVPKVFVVQDLPVPMHVSDGPVQRIQKLELFGSVPISRDIFPEPYRSRRGLDDLKICARIDAPSSYNHGEPINIRVQAACPSLTATKQMTFEHCKECTEYACPLCKGVYTAAFTEVYKLHAALLPSEFYISVFGQVPPRHDDYLLHLFDGGFDTRERAVPPTHEDILWRSMAAPPVSPFEMARVLQIKDRAPKGSAAWLVLQHNHEES